MKRQIDWPINLRKETKMKNSFRFLYILLCKHQVLSNKFIVMEMYYVLKEKVCHIPKDVTHLYLHYCDCDILDIQWPPNLVFLECWFRPFFGYIPETVETLSIVTQRQVLKSNLPKNVRRLRLTCPNAVTVEFDTDDEYDLYKISIHNFGKYNVHVGGHDGQDDDDNMEHFREDDDIYWNFFVAGDEDIPEPPLPF